MYDDMNTKDHQGGYNVHNVIEAFIAAFYKNNFNNISN